MAMGRTEKGRPGATLHTKHLLWGFQMANTSHPPASHTGLQSCSTPTKYQVPQARPLLQRMRNPAPQTMGPGSLPQRCCKLLTR